MLSYFRSMTENKIDKTLEQVERDELNRLIGRGQAFAVRYTVTKKKRRLFKTTVTEEERREEFTIKEPTLAVLDRLSEKWMDMKLDEEALTSGAMDTLREAKRSVNENTHRMAEVIAIAVLGEDYHVKMADPKTGRITYANDEKELGRLTDLFFHTVKPSELVKLCELITSIANLGDFTGSMRLMSGARTTEPRTDRIE